MTYLADPHMPEAVHDRAVAIVGGVHTGSREEGLAEMQPPRELGGRCSPSPDRCRSPRCSLASTALFPRDQFQAYRKSEHVDELTDAAIDTVPAKAHERPAPATSVEVWHMGGAIADVDPSATACSPRSAPFMVSIGGVWTEPADNAAMIAWVGPRPASAGSLRRPART